MIKKLIKLSDGLAVYFTKDEIERFRMRTGDSIDLNDMFLIDVKSSKKNKVYRRLPKSNNMSKEIKEVKQ